MRSNLAGQLAGAAVTGTSAGMSSSSTSAAPNIDETRKVLSALDTLVSRPTVIPSLQVRIRALP